MKKQQVTNKLSFNKTGIIELGDSQLRSIEGGSIESITEAVQQVLDNVHDAAYNASYVISRAIISN